jgi:predicted anti-sigma-YlaC factor YlaD
MVSEPCLRVRRAVSQALDEKAAPAVALVYHLLGCEHCRRFAGLAAEVTHHLRAAPLERPGAVREIETKGARS